MRRDLAPAVAEVAVRMHGTYPRCGACDRPLAHDDQWRCPYVSCRKWLRGLGAEAAA